MTDEGAQIIPFKQRPTPQLIVDKIDQLRDFIATQSHRPSASINRPTELEIQIVYGWDRYMLVVHVDDDRLRMGARNLLRERGDDVVRNPLEGPLIFATYPLPE